MIHVSDGVFREKLKITKSGITLTAENDEVYLTGTDPVKGFHQAGEGMYKVYYPEKVTQLFVKGIPQVRTKYPDQEVDNDLFHFTTINIRFNGDTITSYEITGSDGFFNGATVWMIVGDRWVAGTAKVKKHSGNKLVLTDISLQYRGDGIAFLSDVKNCLNHDGEWFWGNYTLYYINQSIDITKCRMEAKTRERLIELAGVNNVKIQGVNGYGGNIIFNNMQGCKIRNGTFTWLNDYDFIDAKSVYSRGEKASLSMYGLGIAMFGNQDSIICCEVSWATGDCISLYGSNNVITDCKVHDGNYRGTDAAPIALGSTGNQIIHCEIFNAGRDVISAPSAKRFNISYNRIHHSGLIDWDLGIIYTYGTDGENAKIAYNHVYHSSSGNPEDYWGADGIYLDNGSRNFLVHHNLVYDMKGNGIVFNDPGMNLRAYNNTIFHTTFKMTPYNNGHLPDVKPRNCKYYNNYSDLDIVEKPWIETKGNIYTDKDLLQNREAGNFLPRENSLLIDAGVVVEEFKDLPFTGKMSDVGAYEYGLPVWEVGPRCDFNK